MAIPEEHKQLWDKISAFEFDKNKVRFSFVTRLARENLWSKDFAEKALEEYKKFIFLATISDHKITPSDEVDQVWHLHLTDTKSYCQRLCNDTLGSFLHHEPTEGGDDENKRFYQQYKKTLTDYSNYFEQQPPIDIWPNAIERFSRIEYFKRIYTYKRIFVPKIRYIQLFAFLVFLTVTEILEVIYFDRIVPYANLEICLWSGVLFIIIYQYFKSWNKIYQERKVNQSKTGNACFLSDGSDKNKNTGAGGSSDSYTNPSTNHFDNSGYTDSSTSSSDSTCFSGGGGDCGGGGGGGGGGE